MEQIIIYSDGGARGNPGPAGVGVAIEIRNPKSEIRKSKKISKYIGEATNNQAEYKAVIEALSWVTENYREKEIEIKCFLDSELIVEQLNQRYKIKNEGLKPLFWQVRELVLKLGGKISFEYIPREKNKEADRLANLAMDRGK